MLSSKFLQSFLALVILSQNRSIVAGQYRPQRQDILTIISVFSMYFPFLTKALQHGSSEQPGTVQTSSSIVTALCAQEGARGLLHKGTVARNKPNKDSSKKWNKIPYSSETSMKHTELDSKGAEQGRARRLPGV